MTAIAAELSELKDYLRVRGKSWALASLLLLTVGLVIGGLVDLFLI